MVQDERFTEQLSERALAVFKGVVDRYLGDGRPVASSRLARELPLGVSAATVRNVLADLCGLSVPVGHDPLSLAPQGVLCGS